MMTLSVWRSPAPIPPPPLYVCTIHKFASQVPAIAAADALKHFMRWDDEATAKALEFISEGRQFSIDHGTEDVMKTRVTTLGNKLIDKFRDIVTAKDGVVCVFSIDRI